MEIDWTFWQFQKNLISEEFSQSRLCGILSYNLLLQDIIKNKKFVT